MFKEHKWNLVIYALILLVAGALMIFLPNLTMKTLAICAAVLLIALGLYRTICYFMRDAVANFARYDLVIGLAFILGGVVILFKWEALATFIPVILGIVVTLSGIIKLQNSLDLLRTGSHVWGIVFALALINMGFGLFLCLKPIEAARAMMVLVGIGLAFSGLTDLICVLMIGYKVRAIRKAAEGASSAAVVDAAPEIIPTEPEIKP